MKKEFEEMKEAAVSLIAQLDKAATGYQGFANQTNSKLGSLERYNDETAESIADLQARVHRLENPASDKTEGQEIVFVVTYKDAKGTEQVIHVLGIDVSDAVVAARNNIEPECVIVSVAPGPK